MLPISVTLVWAAVTAVALGGQAAVVPGEFRPPPPPEQPVPFNHTVHTSGGTSCVTCHAGAEKAERATLPPVALCMSCHQAIRPESPNIQKLAEYHTKGEEVPWRRVYRLPAFVYFSHAVHAPADKSVTCENCHGNVRELAVMQKMKDTAMATCVACHTAAFAPTRCDSCHEPR
jgi:hypothetical protein